MALRFDLTETMSGTHHFVDQAKDPGRDRAIQFRLVWGAPALGFMASRVKETDAYGVINVEGLTNGEVPCDGKLTLDYFGAHKIVYELDFSVGGDRHHLVAEKVGIRLHKPLELAKTHTTAYGTITNASGTVVSRAVIHFESKDLGRFVTSFRMRRA